MRGGEGFTWREGIWGLGRRLPFCLMVGGGRWVEWWNDCGGGEG